VYAACMNNDLSTEQNRNRPDYRRNRVVVMGILNVTPDSFSDGGRFLNVDAAVAHGAAMVAQGADIIDVGGESTRPGRLATVSVKEELTRVIPVIKRLKAEVNPFISIDTFKPEVAAEAVRAGAGMINDVSMLRYGNELAEIAAEFGVELLIMHSRQTPTNMQNSIKYDNVVADVARELDEAANRAVEVGVPKKNIWLDPGIGFAKTAAHNLELMAGLREIVNLGYRVLVGPSRKSFIDAFAGASVNNRIGGTAAAIAVSVLNGAVGIRVHDVDLMKQAALIAHAIASVNCEEKKHA